MNGNAGRARDLLDDLQATASRADLQTRAGAEKLRARLVDQPGTSNS
jgi:hypothetical protein